jgi:hypothetical protein
MLIFENQKIGSKPVGCLMAVSVIDRTCKFNIHHSMEKLGVPVFVIWPMP